ncbi:uncharacterized protein LOC132308211 isoform X2 [Cornus florida]|uniref:uncharacterized protein LOC132308211 isoform X2 n=1 Tax=Cornus florida TaxID=4283 RepID=UPI00289D9AF5|nr:uncharacterized protein LOC132308211 isoform X2 [Cornus florida]
MQSVMTLPRCDAKSDKVHSDCHEFEVADAMNLQMVNARNGQNMQGTKKERRAARRQQYLLRRQQMEEEQQRLGFQDMGQFQEEREEVQQAQERVRDPEIPPHLNDLVARAIEAGVTTVLRNQPQVQPAPLPAPVVQTDSWGKARSSFTKGSPPVFSGFTDTRVAHQ